MKAIQEAYAKTQRWKRTANLFKRCVGDLHRKVLDLEGQQRRSEANIPGILYNCRLSCGVCSPPTQAPAPPTQAPAPPTQAPCTDENQNCGNWAASGQCEANPAYMLVNCRLSCGVCSPPTQAPAPPTQA